MNNTTTSSHNAFYSKGYQQLLESLKNNQVMRNEALEADTLENFMSEYQYPYGCWPIILSKPRVAEFTRFNRMLPVIMHKVIRSYFKDDPQSFADYLNTSPFLYHMMAKLDVDPRDLFLRHDMVFSNNQFKLLEVNAGSNIGGWQMDWVIPALQKIWQGYPETQSLNLRTRNVVREIFEKACQSMMRLPRSGVVGNLLLITSTVPNYQRMEQDLAALYEQIKPSAFAEGKLVWINNTHDIEVRSDGLAYYKDQVMDAVFLNSDMARDIPQHKIMNLAKSYVAGNLVFPDSPFHNILGNKHLLALLHLAAELAKDATNNKVSLTEEEQQLIQRHIPWTVKLNTPTVTWQGQSYSLPELLKRHQSQFVIKKSLSMQGLDVFIGKTTSKAAWHKVIDDYCQDNDWLVQEYCEPDPVTTCHPDYGLANSSLIWGVFDIGGNYSGAFIRSVLTDTQQRVINSANGAVEFLVVEEGEKAHKLVI